MLPVAVTESATLPNRTANQGGSFALYGYTKIISTAPQMNASLRGAWVNIANVDANKVYAISCCIAYWLDSMGYGDDFKKTLKSLLAAYPQVDPSAMGFPNNWKSEPLWR